jgi:hypothetical protein
MLGERGRYWVGLLTRRDLSYARQRVGAGVSLSLAIALGGALITGSAWWIVAFPPGILLSYRLLR